MVPRPGAPLPFGKYLLLEKIASGGMAEIFRAVLRGAAGFEKPLALKRILPAFCEEPDFVTLFQDEARIASTLAHANIAQVFDFGEVDGSWYLTLELVDGLDLAKMMKRLAQAGQPMPLVTAAFVVAEAARGLAYAHDKTDPDGRRIGIVHRDVSPPNILVSRNGEVKVADFGIAKAAGKVHKTETGVVMGKLRYMSPEQIEAADLDGRSDVFSLGVILYELLASGPIFRGDQSLRLAELILRADIPPPSTRNPAVPAALDAIVMRALARRREERYARAADLARDLSVFVSSTAPGFTREDLGLLVASLLPARVEADAAAPTERSPLPVEAPATAPARRADPPGPTRNLGGKESGRPRGHLRGGLLFGLVLLGIILTSVALVVTRFLLPGKDAISRPDAGRLVVAPPDAGAGEHEPEPPPTAPFTLVPSVSVEQARALANAVDGFDVTRRGVPAPDYAAYLTGLDSAIAGLVLGADGKALEAPGLPPLADAAVRQQGVEDAVTATVEYVRATGELPPLVKSAARDFLRNRPAVVAQETASARGRLPPYSAAALAVWIEGTNRARLFELAYADDVLHRWCEPAPAPLRHFAPLLCEPEALIAALRANDRNDPTARALERYARSSPPEGGDGGLAIRAAYHETVNPDQLDLLVEAAGDIAVPPRVAAGGLPEQTLAAVAPGTFAITVPVRLVAPVLLVGGQSVRLPAIPWATRN